MSDHHVPDCFGSMFPDLRKLTDAATIAGKVFSVGVEQPTGMLRPQPTVTADQTAWHKCAKCPEFDGCYKFSMAQLTLEIAVRGR